MWDSMIWYDKWMPFCWLCMLDKNYCPIGSFWVYYAVWQASFQAWKSNAKREISKNISGKVFMMFIDS